jgi:hypothetical protein
MNPGITTTATAQTAHSSGSRSKRAFARHFGEMLLAMFLGMAVLGGVAALIFKAGGSSLTGASGAVQVLIMGFSMTVPMVAWMRYRGHSTAQNAEMAGSMVTPSLIAAALAAGGVLGSEGALALQHVVMIPAMLGVMLWRYDVYAHTHHSH